MKAVVDTNVFVSALLSADSPPDDVLAAGLRRTFEIVISQPLLDELSRVLARARIADRLGWSDAERRAFVHSLTESSTIVSPSRTISAVDSDPDDNRVLEAALEGEAGYIVTGDAALLALQTFEGVSIVTPARFLAVLAAG